MGFDLWKSVSSVGKSVSKGLSSIGKSIQSGAKSLLSGAKAIMTNPIVASVGSLVAPGLYQGAVSAVNVAGDMLGPSSSKSSKDKAKPAAPPPVASSQTFTVVSAPVTAGKTGSGLFGPEYKKITAIIRGKA